jgi:hypothetical protein
MYHVALALLLAGLAPGPAMWAGAPDPPAASTAVTTGKERLSDKASGEQRVDDCKVPQARRTRARPTSCGLR